MTVGFHNCRFFLANGEQVAKGQGFKRNKLYGSLEYLALTLLRPLLEKHHFKHEHSINGHYNGKRFQYWADFYLPDKRLDIEIDPGFHSSYAPVAKRDQRRDYLLKTVHGIETIRLGPADLTDSAEIVKTIEGWPDSPAALGYYSKGGD